MVLNIKEDLGGKVINHSGKCDLNLDEADFIGLYFSAHWCPPCRRFTPEFARYYDDLKKEGYKFEVVFVSSDQDEASFKEYFKDMPWIALDFSEKDTTERLKEMFGISGIPTLVLLKPDGTLLSKEGRTLVTERSIPSELKLNK